MHNSVNGILDNVFTLFLLLSIGLLVPLAVWSMRRALRFQKKYAELLEQQVAVLRQTNDLLKKLTESR